MLVVFVCYVLFVVAGVDFGCLFGLFVWFGLLFVLVVVSVLFCCFWCYVCLGVFVCL